jgi:hypothetical protein
MADDPEGEDTTDLGDDPPVAWQMEMELVASFITNPLIERFTEAQTAAFGRTTGLNAIHPFARELVHNMTGRLGYPPFTLELLRSAWHVDDDEDVELEVDEYEDAELIREPDASDIDEVDTSVPSQNSD